VDGGDRVALALADQIQADLLPAAPKAAPHAAPGRRDPRATTPSRG
jgi:hypothetical protein